MSQAKRKWAVLFFIFKMISLSIACQVHISCIFRAVGASRSQFTWCFQKVNMGDDGRSYDLTTVSLVGTAGLSPCLRGFLFMFYQLTFSFWILRSFIGAFLPYSFVAPSPRKASVRRAATIWHSTFFQDTFRVASTFMGGTGVVFGVNNWISPRSALAL